MAFTGNEIFSIQGVDNLGRPSGQSEQISLGQIQGFTLTPNPTVFLNSVISSGVGITIPASAIEGGFITRTGAVSNFTDTTDTAPNIISALNQVGGVPIGTGFYTIIKNTTPYNETLVGGQGVSIVGGSTVTPNSEASYFLSPSSASTISLTLLAVGNGGSALLNTQFNTLTNTSSFTCAASNLAGALNTFINLTGTLGAPSNIQTDTATNIFNAIPNPVPGVSYISRIINSSAASNQWTVTAGTGVSLNGTMTMQQNTWREFVVNLVSAASVNFQSVGTGTQS